MPCLLERPATKLLADRFPAPRQVKNGHDVRFAVIDEISRQASETWGMGNAQVAFDFMRISITAPSVPAMQVEEEVGEGSVGDQVNASDIENGGAVGYTVRQWGSSDTRDRRGGRGTRERGRGRGRGTWGSYNGEMNRDGMAGRRGMKSRS